MLSAKLMCQVSLEGISVDLGLACQPVSAGASSHVEVLTMTQSACLILVHLPASATFWCKLKVMDSKSIGNNSIMNTG